MMGMPHGKKRLELLPFEENTKRSIPLPRNRYIKEIDLYFTGQLVIAGGGSKWNSG